MVRVIKFNEPPLATLHELRTVYTFADFLDFLEIIDLHESVMDQHRVKMEQALEQKKGYRG